MYICISSHIYRYMYICISVYLVIYIDIYIDICKCIYVYLVIYRYICISSHIYRYIYRHMYICISSHIYRYIYRHMYICISSHIYILYIYIYIYLIYIYIYIYIVNFCAVHKWQELPNYINRMKREARNIVQRKATTNRIKYRKTWHTCTHTYIHVHSGQEQIVQPIEHLQPCSSSCRCHWGSCLHPVFKVTWMRYTCQDVSSSTPQICVCKNKK